MSQWPPRFGVYNIPRPMQDGEALSLRLRTPTHRNRLTVNLAVDEFNIACQVDMNFDNNTITIRVIEDGSSVSEQETQPANDVLPEMYRLLNLTFKSNEGNMQITAGVSYEEDEPIDGQHLAFVPLRQSISEVKYIECRGDVNVSRLNFHYNA